MARSIASNSSKQLFSALVDAASASLQTSVGRSYSSAASQRIISSVVSSRKGLAKQGGGGEERKPEASWVPDPVTGYYRPESGSGDQIDVAELRQMLINQKIRQS